MKKMNDWFEYVVENTIDNRDVVSRFIILLVVLFAGAGSLYMLLNSPA